MDSLPFRNLVFEGGGAKGIAYVGALEELEARQLLPQIERVAGSSAGAVLALFLALGYSVAQIRELLFRTSFNHFLDGSWFFVVNVFNLLSRLGWHPGRRLESWLQRQIYQTTGKANYSFADLEAEVRKSRKTRRLLYVTGTNLTLQRTEIFSHETTPEMPLCRAVRISSSIPLFFRLVTYQGDRYVDGGLFYNYPLHIFDEQKYLEHPSHGKPPVHRFTEQAVYNCETLGFRVDSREEMRALKDEPVRKKIHTLLDYIAVLMSSMLDRINRLHLHPADWHRTVFIDSLGIKTTQFDLSPQQKSQLIASGRQGTRAYFRWYEAPTPNEPYPLNRLQEE